MLLALLAVALLEASNAATGVKNLLLAGVERVALRAHVNEHVIFLPAVRVTKVLPHEHVTSTG